MKGLSNILKPKRKEITGNIQMLGFKMKNQLHREIKRWRKKLFHPAGFSSTWYSQQQRWPKAKLPDAAV